jgi:HD-GYP domain-containing protein (c-di-GMP phosphodiesterase class II)
VVEAMSCHRPYRPALGMEAAIKEITDHRATRYDASAVDACCAVVGSQGFCFEEDSARM